MSIAGMLLAICLISPSAKLQSPPGYIAAPRARYARGVLVLHAWWGLNGDVKSYCDRLAKAGFYAFAPDLFEGKTAKTAAEAEALANATDPKLKQLEAQVSEAAKFLSHKTGDREIAAIGISFGDYFALRVSDTDPSLVRAVVIYYGNGPGKFANAKAAYLCHFAENDQFNEKADLDHLVKRLTDAGRPVTVYSYPGTGHWFAEPSVKQAYNRGASELAWKRTLQFLHASLK